VIQNSTLQKLTDDDIREILLTPMDVGHTDLAKRYDISSTRVASIRNRKSFRAIALAKELGLLPLSPKRCVWAAHTRGKASITVTASAARRA
jgi:hypothetical protein